MVHKKYIKRGNKVFGPYYYENYRVGDKVKTKYLGTKPPSPTTLRIRNFAGQWNKRVLLLILVISISTTFFGIFSINFTGLFIQERETIHVDKLGLSYEEPREYLWKPENAGELVSLKLNGKIEGNGTVRVYLEKDGERYLVLDSSGMGNKYRLAGNTISVTGFIISSNESNLTNVTINETLTNETDNTGNGEDEEEIDETLNETGGNVTNFTAPIIENVTIENVTNVTVPLIENVTNQNETNLTSSKNVTVAKNLTVPTVIENVTLLENITENVTEMPNITEEFVITFDEECIETCSLFGFKESSYILVFEVEPGTRLEIYEIVYSMLEEIVVPSAENITAAEMEMARLKNSLSTLRLGKHSKKIEFGELKKIGERFNLDVQFDGSVGGRGGLIRLFGLRNISELKNIQTGLVREKVEEKVINTEVIAVNPINFSDAEITLPKHGPVSMILRCDDWDFDNFECEGEWTETGMPFTENGTHVTFTVTEFSGYAGADINIINVQSYPTVGGKWTVIFETNGTANLTITAVNGTTWSNVNEDYDLKFLGIKCGYAVLEYQWIDNGPGNSSVFIENYSCNETGYEISKVLTPGVHTLEFRFGEYVAYARNKATERKIVGEWGHETDLQQGSWTEVKFKNEFDGIPVVVHYVEYDYNYDDNPCATRIKNVTKEGFYARAESWDSGTEDDDCPSTGVGMYWMAMKKGIHNVTDNDGGNSRMVEVQNFTLDKDYCGSGAGTPSGWNYVQNERSFQYSWTYRPAVLASVQTADDDDTIIWYIHQCGTQANVWDNSCVEIGLNGLECQGSYNPCALHTLDEEGGYIAWEINDDYNSEACNTYETGNGTDTYTYELCWESDSVLGSQNDPYDIGSYYVTLSASYADGACFGSSTEIDGGNGLYPAGDYDAGSNMCYFLAEEDQNGDAEQGHIAEPWLAIFFNSSSGFIYSNETIEYPTNLTAEGDFIGLPSIAFNQSVFFQGNCSEVDGDTNATDVYIILQDNRTEVWNDTPTSGQDIYSNATYYFVGNITASTTSENYFNITAPVTGNYYFRVQCNASNAGESNSTPRLLTVYDPAAPAWSNVGANETNPSIDDYVKFYAYWEDDYNLSSWIFSWNATVDDSWENKSAESFSGTGKWSNKTLQIPAYSAGKIIGYRFYANDTRGNLNATDIKTISVQSKIDAEPPQINWFNATPNITGYGQTVTIATNITDNVGVDSGSVKTNVTFPNNSSVLLNMGYKSGDIWELDFNDTWQWGKYSYFVQAEDTSALPVSSSDNPENFSIRVNATVLVNTEKETYSANKNVYLTEWAGWMNKSWPYRMPINISENLGVNLTNYQVNISVDTKSLISQGKMNGSCNDIRFVNSSNDELSFWLESGCNTTDTKVWVKLPLLQGSAKQTIYMYYGYKQAGSKSNISSTYEIVGEAGTIDTDHNWKTVNFNYMYSEAPVVFADAMTYNDNAKMSARINATRKGGFDVRVEEYHNLDGPHGTEIFGWVALKNGSWIIGNLRADVGTDSIDSNYKTVNFGFDFGSTPAVISDIQSYNEGGDSGTAEAGAHTRQNNPTSSSMEIRVEEANDSGSHTYETIGYLAIEEGVANTTYTNGVYFETGWDDCGPDLGSSPAWLTLSFTNNFGDTPGMIGAMMNENGYTDNSNTRMKDVGTAQFDITIEETPDFTGGHGIEPVGWFAIDNTSTIYGRKYVEQAPSVMNLGEEELTNLVDNEGTTDTSGYLLMQVTDNDTGEVIATQVNDSQTQTMRNVSTGGYLELGPIWNANPWNTDDYGTGYYNVLVVLTDLDGNVLVNDTGDNITGYYTLYIDRAEPEWNNLGANNTNPKPLEFVEFYCNWSDNGELDSWVFEWNVSGSMEQNGSGSFIGNPDWSNITRQIPSSMEIRTIAYRFVANDTEGNDNTTDTKYIDVQDVTPPVISNEYVSPGMININQSVDITADVTDNSGAVNTSWMYIGVPGDGYENETMTLLSGNTYNLSYKSTERGTYNATVYANDSSGNADNGSVVFWDVYGWSNVSWIDPDDGSYPRGSVINLICLVEDANYSGAISDYYVTFWHEGGQLGANYTNQSGYALYEWNTSNVDGGLHTVNCTIGDNSSLYYNASAVDNAYTSVTVLVPDLNVTVLEHENEHDHSVNEYETGDTIDWVNVTVNNTGGSTAYEVNVTLNLLDPAGDLATWFDEQVEECGSLSVSEVCEVQFSGDTILESADPGTYTWNVTINWSGGGSPPNYNTSSTFFVHHVPDNLSSSLSPTKILQKQSVIYNITIVNPWSLNVTSVNVTIGCHSNMTCNCSLAGQTDQLNYCYLGNVSDGGNETVSFNVTTNSSTVPGEYDINANVNYTNPGLELRSWTEQENQILSVRGPTKLRVNVTVFSVKVTRGSATGLRGYVNNTGTQVTNQVTLNWTLPPEWTNITGDMNVSNETLCADCLLWNNITANLSYDAELGEQKIELRAGSEEEEPDWKTETVTVYANTSIPEVWVNDTNPYRNSSVKIMARLLYDNSSPVTGESIMFKLNDTVLGSNSTNSTGYAVLYATVPYDAGLGSKKVNATYAGSGSIYTNPRYNDSLVASVQDDISIGNVAATPQIQGYGQNVTISADVWSRIEIGIVRANVTYPNGSWTWVDMGYSGSGNSYSGVFAGIWDWGDYSYWIWANNTVDFGNDTSSSPETFYLRANASVGVQTEKYLYGSNQNVLLDNQTWLDLDWPYRMPFNISENSGADLVEYALNISVNTKDLISQGKMNGSCSDIRFTNSTGDELPFWLESDCNDTNTSIWVKIPSLDALSNQTIYMYYGNLDAENKSNFTAAWKVIGEANVTKVNTTWHTISLKHSYTTPVVVHGPADFDANQDEEVVGRVTNVSSDGFEFKLQEPNEGGCRDDVHPDENISYIVVENGSWVLSDGRKLEAGNYSTSTTTGRAIGGDNTADPAAYDLISYRMSFSSAPVVVSQTMGYDDSDYDKTRMMDVTSSSFRISHNEDEGQSDIHGPEMVGWIAVEPGNGSVNGVDYNFGTTVADRYIDYCASPYECPWATQTFSIPVTNPPVLIANMQTVGGGDNAYIRYNNPTTSSVDFGVEEDPCSGTEKGGADETVGWMVFAGPVEIYGRQFLSTYPTVSNMSEEIAGNSIRNTGSLNISGYLLMQVEGNGSGYWEVIGVVADETFTRTINAGDSLNLVNIWNSDPWNTTGNTTGYYRVYTAFRGLDGAVLKNDSGGFINGSDVFRIEVEGPDIADVTATPQIIGYDQNLTISATITDSAGVAQAKINIIYPNSSTTSVDMVNTQGDTWACNFSYTWQWGDYNYSIWAQDNFGDANETSSNYQFSVRANVTVNLTTEYSVYGDDGLVNLSAASVKNTGTTNISLYFLMQVQVNDTGEIIATQVDDAQTETKRNVSAGKTLDIASVWNANPWNTTKNGTGYYNVLVTLTDPYGNVLTNDTGDNISGYYTFYIDRDEPEWNNLGANNTNPKPLEWIKFYCNWSDNGELDSWVFEWNVSGSMEQNGSGSFIGNPDWSNITRQIPSSAELKTIAYRFVANDTKGNSNTTDMKYVNIQDVTPPVISNEDVTPDLININQTVNITADITDNSGGVNASWAYIGMPSGGFDDNRSLTLLSGDTYNLTYKSTERGTYNVTVYANDSSANVDNGSVVTWDVYGWSNVTWIDPDDGSCPRGSVINLTCLVGDANYSTGIEDYSVMFWHEGGQLGANYTNQSGYAVYEWNTSDVDGGMHTVNCTIGDNSSLYYSASSVDNAYTTLTILVPDLNVTELEHENEYDNSVNEYETGDTIDWANVTVNNTGGSTAYDVNVTLNLLDPQNDLAAWFDEQSILCGSLSVGETCEVQFAQDTIQTGADPGTYTWNVTINWSGGGSPPNYNATSTFIIHHVPDNLSSVISPSKVQQNQSAVYNITIVNPWSLNMTSVNVTIGCDVNMTCNCSLAGQLNQIGYCYLGNVSSTENKTASFNITTNSSTVPGEYDITATVNYTNPGLEERSLAEQQNQILSVRGPTKLSVNISAYSVKVTRGQSYVLKGYVNNTGEEITNNVTLNWTLPPEWTNITGDMNISNETLCAGCLLWNNITANLSYDAGLGQKEIELRSESEEEEADWDTKSVTVYANTSIPIVLVNDTNPYRNGSILIQARLLYDNSSPVTGESITFKLNGNVLGSDDTNSSGYAALHTMIPYDANIGSNTVNASYAGSDLVYTNSKQNDSVSVSVQDEITIDNVVAIPQIQGYAQNVTISADVWSRVEIDTVRANVTYPNGTWTWLDLDYSGSGNIYSGVFESIWDWGDYSYWIWANNTMDFANETSGSPEEFYLRVNASIDLQTEETIYGPNQYVSIDTQNWWNKSWEWRIKINITEESGSNLTDYQVNITLNTTDFIQRNRMNNDCSDVRFVFFNDSVSKGGNTRLYHWIGDDCNQGNTTVWVKIPLLQENSNLSIYMYYGNPDAASESNISGTFVFGDDFKRPDNATVGNDWIEDGGYEAYSSVENNQLKISSGSSTGAYWKQVHHTMLEPDGDYVVEFKGDASQTDKNVFSNYFGEQNNRRLTILFCSDGKIKYLNQTAFEDTTKTYSPNTYFDFRIWYKKSAGKGNYYVNGDLEGEDADPGPTTTYTNEIAFGGVSGSVSYWDDVRVRKFVSTEPSIALLEEESVNSVVNNVGSTNISFYSVMQVKNATSDEVISTQINDSNTQTKRTVNSGEVFNLSSVWEDNPWDTGDNPTGYYMVYVALTGPTGDVLLNDTLDGINKTYEFYLDAIPPSFIDLANQTIMDNETLSYDIDASDSSGIDCFKVNDTNFTIDCSGLLTNATSLDVGMYWLNITVNDTVGNENSGTIYINVTSSNLIPPNTTEMVLNSTSGNNYTTDDLHCWAIGEDPEDENLNAYWQWWNGSQPVLSGNTSVQNGTLTEIAVLGSGNTSKGETWTCSVKMSDGVNNETEWNNASLTIQNSKPVLTSVDITPFSPKTTDTLDCGSIGYDVDAGEVLRTNFTWYRDTGSGYQEWHNDDENEVATSNDTYVNTSAVGDIEPADTSKTYKFICQASLYDDSGEADSMNSSAVTIQNSPPNPDSNWNPGTTHDPNQNFTWTEGSDDDGDGVTSVLCIDEDSAGRDSEVCDIYSGSGLDSPVTDVVLTYDGASETYYGRLRATDGEAGSTNYDFTFTLTNAQPAAPSAASLDGQTTGDSTPTITFTKGTDTDANPTDTVTQYVSVDSGGYTDSGNTYTSSGDIDEFTITPDLSNGIYYVRQWANDNTGASNAHSNNYEYTFTVQAEISIESISIQPDEGDPGIIINPIENSNKTVNVTVTVDNSTDIDVCEIRIFNSSTSYTNPVFYYTGVIQNCGTTCDCFREWDMEYWRNDGDWNVSVYINVTNGVGNFTSQNFTYNILTSIDVNTSTITFTGIPDQTVNSIDAYPLEIKNTGNQVVDISLNGTDFTGMDDSSYVVGVGNATYNETTTGAFKQLTYDYVLIFENLSPAVARNLYFRAYLPVGFISQDYQSYIEISTS